MMRSIIVTPEQQSIFLSSTRGAEFIFDREIKNYIDEIWSKSVDLQVWQADELPSTHALEKSAHMMWVAKQFTLIDVKFKKFMQLEH